MKQTRKGLSVALALVMVLLLTPVILPTAAEAAEDTSDGNVSITVDNATPNVGDTVTVTLSNEDMTVSVFTCGISFDTTKLQCTDINTIDSPITDSAKLVEPQLTTLDSTDVEAGTDANSTGRVGFGVVSVDQTSPHDKSIDAGDFLAVEFTVLEAGEITITAYEDSAGADGVTGDKGAKDVDSVKLTSTEVRDISVIVNTYNSGATVTEPASGWVAGSNTFTVACDKACVVAVSHDGGITYTRLAATASGSDYSFTATDVADGDMIAVVVLGDVNRDGSVTAIDYTLVLTHVKGIKLITNPDVLIAADVNKDGSITAIDYTLILAHVKGIKSLW